VRLNEICRSEALGLSGPSAPLATPFGSFLNFVALRALLVSRFCTYFSHLYSEEKQPDLLFPCLCSLPNSLCCSAQLRLSLPSHSVPAVLSPQTKLTTESSSRPNPIPGPSGSSPRFAYHLHHHSRISSSQTKVVILYLVASEDLCISKPLLIRRPNHSSSLQCTLSSSLKWSSKSSPAASEASSSFTLSSAAFNSRRTLAESR
jgi:hypothetical protein